MNLRKDHYRFARVSLARGRPSDAVAPRVYAEGRSAVVGSVRARLSRSPAVRPLPRPARGAPPRPRASARGRAGPNPNRLGPVLAGRASPSAPRAHGLAGRRRLCSVRPTERARRTSGSPSRDACGRPLTPGGHGTRGPQLGTQTPARRAPADPPRALGYPTLPPPSEGRRGVQCLPAPGLGRGGSARAVRFCLWTLVVSELWRDQKPSASNPDEKNCDNS